MDLTYATLAVMVNDRHRAFEHGARRRRSLLARFRQETPTTLPRRLPVPADRTSVDTTPRAA